MTDNKMSVARVRRKVKKHVDKRVGKDSAHLFRDELDKFLEDLADKAAGYADHAGKKTIRPEDVKAAIRSL